MKHDLNKNKIEHNENAITLKNIHLTLGEGASEVHVLKGIDLNIEPHKSLSLVGPSGSGKSTLLMVLAGLEKIDKGEIWISGTNLTTLDEDQLAQFRGENIGIVFQSFHLMANMTALENVALPLELSYNKDAQNTAKEMLKAVGLSDRLHHYPHQLSGGEQQRVAIARALAPNPKLLICDEPTGNLDEETGEKIISLLFELQNQHHFTFVLVTHDTQLASKADHKISMLNGNIQNATY